MFAASKNSQTIALPPHSDYPNQTENTIFSFLELFTGYFMTNTIRHKTIPSFNLWGTVVHLQTQLQIFFNFFPITTSSKKLCTHCTHPVHHWLCTTFTRKSHRGLYKVCISAWWGIFPKPCNPKLPLIKQKIPYFLLNKWPQNLATPTSLWRNQIHKCY